MAIKIWKAAGNTLLYLALMVTFPAFWMGNWWLDLVDVVNLWLGNGSMILDPNHAYVIAVVSVFLLFAIPGVLCSWRAGELFSLGLTLLTLLIFFGLPVTGAAQEPPRGMYTYSVFNDNPLPVGAPVWANIGDNKCAYFDGGDYPSVEDKCFDEGGYRKAKIIEIFAVRSRWEGRRYYFYRIEFEPLRANSGRGPRWDASLDEALEIYNLPEKWASHSRYFIRLNW